jgi:L-alanine-DL-glutamate epimerase-like enolase superfamily enzyme
MKITDLRCAVIGKHPIVRIVTDEGLYGLGEVEFTKTYLKPWVLHFREALIGEDPTDVERVMLKIRQRGSFKPYGAAVSAIEHALWDIAGKAANVPVYKLLGGKVRDQVRVYNGSIRKKRTGDRPEDYAADVKWMMEQPQNFFMVKQGISFHSNMKDTVEDFHYGTRQTKSGYHGAMDQGMISEHGFNHMLDCVAAMKEVLGDKVSLALDCGPGWMLPDAIKFARAVEKYNIMWLEDMLTGDYVPWVNPQAYRELTLSTSTPIHTGEQIYLRHNFNPDGAARHGQRALGARGADQCLRHAAGELYRVRVSERLGSVVERHRDRAAQAGGEELDDRRARGPRPRPRYRRRGREEIPPARGCRVLRLRRLPQPRSGTNETTVGVPALTGTPKCVRTPLAAS